MANLALGEVRDFNPTTVFLRFCKIVYSRANGDKITKRISKKENVSELKKTYESELDKQSKKNTYTQFDLCSHPKTFFFKYDKQRRCTQKRHRQQSYKYPMENEPGNGCQEAGKQGALGEKDALRCAPGAKEEEEDARDVWFVRC